MPAQTESATADEYTYYVDEGATRNYTMFYDTATYTPLWVAYPLKSSYDSDNGTTYSASWAKNPDIAEADQVTVWKGSYGVGNYARGHMIPDASRDGNKEMIEQAYYATNSVPQIQDGFNGGIWASIEQAVRGQINESNYELYVVTGAVFQTVGGSEEISYITPTCDSSKSVPVPNYFYKVALKAKVDSSGTVTSASTIGFWIKHDAYSGVSATNYAVSVDQIEQWTGFDYFANLPDTIEAAAESNSTWATFQNF